MHGGGYVSERTTMVSVCLRGRKHGRTKYTHRKERPKRSK